MDDKVISPEKAEEAKLKARYPNLGAKPGGSDFLRKRLQKGVRIKHWFLYTLQTNPILPHCPLSLHFFNPNGIQIASVQ